MLLDIRVLIFLGVIMALVLMSSADSAEVNKSASYLSDLEAEILREMNLARTQPRRYAEFLEERRRHYRGNHFERPGEIAIITQEGAGAVDEAIDFLLRVEPVGALRPAQGMSRLPRTMSKTKDRQEGWGIEGRTGVGCRTGLPAMAGGPGRSERTFRTVGQTHET